MFNKSLEQQFDINEFDINEFDIKFAIPIAKVIWTKHWENETNKFVSSLNPEYLQYLYSINEFQITDIQIRYFSNTWDELHVKDLNNNWNVLYNYNHIDPVVGIRIH